MSLRGYVKKGNPANWTQAFPAQIHVLPQRCFPRGVGAVILPADGDLKKAVAIKWLKPVSKRARSLTARYPGEARAFVAEAVERGETCPVVAQIPELRDGFKYGHPISGRLTEVHHIAGRGYGGRGPLLMDKRLWMAVSRLGHRWIEMNKEEARKYGWLAPLGRYNVPVPADAQVVRNQYGGVWIR